MDKLIVFVDDPAHALRVLQPWLAADPQRLPRQWILVACPPRVTHHVSKWVTHSARESWRGKWANRLFAQLVPELQVLGDQVLTTTGKNNPTGQVDALLLEHGQARVIDARRPKAAAAEPSAMPAAQRPSRGDSSVFSLWLSLAGTGMTLAAE